MTKGLLFAFIGMILAGAVKAQGKDSTQYLFGGNIRVSGGGGFMMQLGNVDIQDGLVTGAGGGGGIIFDDRLLLGGYGMGLSSNVHRTLEINDSLDLAARLNFGHGGFWIQYSFMPKKAIHPMASLQLGWGSATWNFDGKGPGQGNGYPQDLTDLVMVITPSIGMEMNIKPWFRPNVYIGMRIVDGLDLPDVDPGGLNGFFGGISLLFGGFGDQP